MKLSGRMTRSTDECEMSRSCHSAMFSSAAIALPRSSRASPVICSQPIGLRLCGIADEPFWPLPNGSSISPISVFCRPADLQRELLERRGRRSPASSSARRADRAGSPATRPAPAQAELLADARLDRRIEVRERADRARDLADARRRRARAARGRDRAAAPAYHSASLTPSVIGSAWTPWVRPIIGVRRCSSARSRDRLHQRRRGP